MPLADLRSINEACCVDRCPVDDVFENLDKAQFWDESVPNFMYYYFL